MRCPSPLLSARRAVLDSRILGLIATVIECCGHRGPQGRGHPPAATVRVLATLRQFLREGTPWRCLLAPARALLAGMLRGRPDLSLDRGSVRGKRGGDLTGPNPTDRAKRGPKYHLAVDGDGVPVARAATAAKVNDTLASRRDNGPAAGIGSQDGRPSVRRHRGLDPFRHHAMPIATTS